MHKLRTLIQYEYLTSVKHLFIYYPIQFAIYILPITFTIILNGTSRSDGSFELISLTYFALLAALGFRQDLRMCIQNGFTRKYIFLATCTMFISMASTMALFDLIFINLFHVLTPTYTSLYTQIYGALSYSPLMHWFWMVLVYMCFGSLAYLCTLIINKLGKNGVIYFILGCFVCISLLLLAMRYMFSIGIQAKVFELILLTIGFAGGTIHMLYPVLTLLLWITIFLLGSYAIIRRIEIH